MICPHRDLNFGARSPVQEFVERRVLWVELQPRDGRPPATPLTQVLSLLLQPEANVPTITRALRLLARRCGSLSAATTARIQALPLEQLEALAEALLEFTGPADLDAWLAAHA